MLYYVFRKTPEEMFVPLYEYLCPKCGHRFEKIEKLGAAEIKKCPKCGGKAERTITSPAIQFKGSGWYVTDYAGKSTSGGSSEPKKTETSSPSESGSSSESSKPAPAKESKSSKKEKS
jgi:putative FmdB family regulatory protein